MPGMAKSNRLTFLMGIVAAGISWIAASYADLPPAACWTATVTALCAAWWILEPIPILATSLIPFAVFPLLGVLTHKQVAASYGHHLILLFMGGFMLSAAMEKSGAHRRVALGMVHLVGGQGGRRLVLAFMLATALLSMWISNTATALMMLPVALAVLADANDRRLEVPLLLGIAYGASIGGIGTPIGTPPNVVFMGVYSEQTGTEISFQKWMTIGVPVVVVMLPIAWLWLTRGLGGAGRVETPSPGQWRAAELRVLIVFVITALAWMTRTAPWGGWSNWFDMGGAGDSTVALLAVVAMFLIPNSEGGRLLDWETARSIPWGLLILFGGGLAIAKAFGESGLSEALGGQLQGLSGWPTILMIGLICLTVTFLTEVTSNTATTTLLMPILAAAAKIPVTATSPPVGPTAAPHRAKYGGGLHRAGRVGPRARRRR